MIRLCLVLLLFSIHFSYAQQQSNFSSQAGNSVEVKSPKIIAIASKALKDALGKKANVQAADACMVLGKTYRKDGYYNLSIYYDSLSVAYARKQNDSLLLQKAINSYAQNFVEEMMIREAGYILDRDSLLYTKFQTAEACRWYEMKAFCALNQIQLLKAVRFAEKAMQVAAILNDTLTQMHAQMIWFKCRSISLSPPKTDPAFEALAYFEKTNNQLYTAQAANVIGYAFESTGSTDKAIEYYQKAIYHFTALNNNSEVVQTQINMADAYKVRGDSVKVKSLLWASYCYYVKKKFNKGIASAALRLGKEYADEKRRDSALFFFAIVDSVNEQLNSPVIKLGSDVYKAQSDTNKQRRDSALENVINKVANLQHERISREALNRMKEAGTLSKEDLQQHNRFLNKKDSTKDIVKQPEIADYERLQTLAWQTGANSDSNLSTIEKSRREMLEVEKKFDIKSYKDTIAQREKEKAEAKKQSGNLFTILTISTLSLIFVSGILWWQYHKRRRTEEEKAKVEQLQKEIHHRVTNNLSAINAMVQASSKVSGGLPVAALKTRIDSIALVHRLLYGENAAIGKISLQHYMEALCKSISNIFGTEKGIVLTVYTPVQVDSKMAEKLGLIVNELVTNSYKYAFADKDSGTVHLYARQADGQLYLTVADNGIGLPENSKKGYGSKLIKGLTHELDGVCNYYNMDGTFFEITVPV